MLITLVEMVHKLVHYRSPAIQNLFLSCAITKALSAQAGVFDVYHSGLYQRTTH
ncbi:hypothetical protein Plhal710r2_c018g0077031 [Plasmopara halstedii]